MPMGFWLVYHPKSRENLVLFLFDIKKTIDRTENVLNKLYIEEMRYCKMAELVVENSHLSFLRLKLPINKNIILSIWTENVRS